MKLDTRNTLLRNPLSFDGTVYLNLKLLISKSVSTSSNPCKSIATTYDQCIQKEYLKQLYRTNACLLPFLEQQQEQNLPYCESFESGMTSLSLYQNVSDSCMTPCLLVIPDLTLQLEDKYITNSLKYYQYYPTNNTKDRSGLFILLPNDAELMESEFTNSLFSSMANFLGVASLFYGISAMTCLDLLTNALTWTTKAAGLKMPTCKHLTTSCKIILIFTLTGLIIWILIVFISKYASFPTETQVALDIGIPKMSMAICSSKDMKELSFGIRQVWKDGFDIRKKITDFTIMATSGKWITVWNSSFLSIMEKDIFQTIIFPLNNQTLQFCQSLDLSTYSDLAKVYSLIIIYFIYNV
jgi:hypothetical protein